MSREIKISYMWQDGESWIEKVYNLSQIEAGDHYSDMSDCPFLKNYRVIARRQYTGLKDKHGKEIYEGDILRYIRYNWKCYEHPKDGTDVVSQCSVFWSEEHRAFRDVGRFETGGGWEGYLHFKDERADKNEIEIIGNIYENPELLP